MLPKMVERLRLPGWVRTVVRMAGFELVRAVPATDVAARRLAMFRRAGIDLILDVGANTGQYARQLREMGYQGRIVSFEPLSSAFAVLQQACANDGAWEAVQVALGSAPGTASINVSANSWSSSLLEMLPRHLESAPGSAYVSREEVKVQTLAWALQRGPAATHIFVKLDVQGSERAILDGAGSSLDRVAGVQVELSLAPLFQGETLFLEMVGRLSSQGFVLMDLEPGHRDPATGQLLQVDGIFFRVNATPPV